MAGVGGATSRRRKIFPHLKDDDKKPPSAPEASGSANGDSGKANGDASDETNAYVNSKQKKGSSHPSAAKKNLTSSKSSDSINGSIHHLLPLPLVLTVLVCSGLFWLSSFRDVMATGKPILDSLAVLWGQDDADARFLVRSFHDFLPAPINYHLPRPHERITNISNTPNLRIGSTIPAAGNPNRVAFPPSLPRPPMPTTWEDCSFVNCRAWPDWHSTRQRCGP